MTDRDLMQQALDALEIAEVDGNCCYEATELLRTRLTQPAPQPKQKPVAWLNKEKSTIFWSKLYPDMQPLYTTPPQRKPLTDEEISKIAINNPPRVHEFARAIEAAHGIKEKNNG